MLAIKRPAMLRKHAPVPVNGSPIDSPETAPRVAVGRAHKTTPATRNTTNSAVPSAVASAPCFSS
ncbi:MAG: hypothetical protein M5U28_44010 [Sandaracinaceae bacterium]|nr:hypothetical protein [Sandaracinaceae bacterium]